jgi:O-antigen ligase
MGNNPALTEAVPSAPGLARRVATLVRGTMEGLVLLMVGLSPWAFGCRPPVFEAVLFVGLAVLLGLWALRMLLEWRLIWTSCPVALCLAGLFILGVWQITPLRPSILETVSPSTASLDSRLLPASPDRLPGGQVAEPVALAAGSTISLYPAGTRAVVLQILAVFALYAVVRSNLTSAASFRRLAVVCLVNGFMLSLFGLLQFFTSPSKTVYWFLPTEALVFGPFNRNVFACYNNLCIGLGIGALLSANSASRGATAVAAAAPRERLVPAARRSLPALAWIGAALTLMLAAQALSLSRGGLLSLLGALGLCSILALFAPSRLKPLAQFVPLSLLILGLAVGLVAWFGMDRVQARLGTLGEKETFEVGRPEGWTTALPWVKDFPVWGAGYGTFPYLEQLRRAPNSGPDFFWDHAHNNYLEILLEGGAVGLAVGLAAIAAVYRFGLHGLMRRDELRAGPLALGALFAFTTLVLHSFVDYGLYYPATAVLAAVLCAQVSGLGRAGAVIPVADDDPLWRRTAGCLLGAGCVIVVCFLLASEGRADLLASRYRGAARVHERTANEEGQARRIAYLEAAAFLRPEDASLQLDLADAYYESYTHQTYRTEQRRRALAVAEVLLIGADARPPSALLAGLVSAGSGLTASALTQEQQWEAENRQFDREYLIPSLRHYLLARNLCPLLDRPHIRLAAHATGMDRTDPVAVHLDRARLVVPYKAQIWYLSGLQDLEAGHQEEAWEKWHKSLECSNEYLPGILAHSRKHMSVAEIATRVLPDDPVELNEAAGIVRRQGEDDRPVLEKALEMLEQPRSKRTPELLHLRAEILHRLQQPDRSLLAYEELLSQATSPPEWRLEFAQLLSERGRLQESRRELVRLLDDDPQNEAARSLYTQIIRRIAAGD